MKARVMKRAHLIVSLLICGRAFALTFMGPPASDIRQGQTVEGFDYSQASTDFRVEGISSLLTDVQTDAYMWRSVFGLVDGAELAFRVGISDIDEMGNELAWGGAGKVTFAKSDYLDWGVLVQMTAFHAEDSASIGSFSISGDYDIYEYQAAVGPTLKMGSLSVYGGALFHFVTSDVDITVMGTPYSLDLEQESEFGGYGGLSWHIDDQTSLSVEYQATADADAIGISLIHRFGEPSSKAKRAGASRTQPRGSTTSQYPRPRPPKKNIKEKLLRDESGNIAKDKDGNFIFVPVEE